MNEQLKNELAIPIERYGVTWRIPTMADMAKFQARIEMPEALRCLLGLTDIMRWCATPTGIDITLKTCGDVTDEQLGGIGALQRLSLVNDLIDRFLGPGEDKASGEEAPPRDPLADRSGTGT